MRTFKIGRAVREVNLKFKIHFNATIQRPKRNVISIGDLRVKLELRVRSGMCIIHLHAVSALPRWASAQMCLLSISEVWEQ